MEFTDYKVTDLDLLFDLVNHLSFIDGSMSFEESEIIKELVSIYNYTDYKLGKVVESELLNRLEKVSNEELKNLLVISVFVAYSDGIIDESETTFLRKTSEFLTETNKADFIIEGDRFSQKVIRLHIYHLLVIGGLNAFFSMAR